MRHHEILWQDYQRHETKQPEKTLEFLKRMEKDAGISRHNTRMFLTGSGGEGHCRADRRQVRSGVTAVSLASKKLHPEVYSVVELAGKTRRSLSSKMTTSRTEEENSSMNDKCAGAQARVIDKINAKLKISGRGTRRNRISRNQAAQSSRKCGVLPRPTSTACKRLAHRLMS